MKSAIKRLTVWGVFSVLSCCSLPGAMAEQLPSWAEGAAKQSILAFVQRVSQEGSADYVPAAERIAVFDNDGTLWAEKPVYVQLLFAMDRVRQLADEHPEWQTTQPFQAVLENDMEALAKSGEHGLLQLVMASHADMTTEEFASVVSEWLAKARHPQTGKPFTAMVYQPMLELLDYLRANGFKTFIVSGGGIEFMRPWTEQVYGIPPEQVIGSSIKTKFDIRDGKPVLIRQPEIVFIDDKAGKPVGIQQHIGRRPIAAFGNSDGDLQMLQWTCLDRGNSLCLLVHHTDSEREWAYDRDSSVGRLDKALQIAEEQGWTITSIKDDWRQVYP